MPTDLEWEEFIKTKDSGKIIASELIGMGKINSGRNARNKYILAYMR